MSVPYSNASILIVEDEVIVALDIAQNLENHGYLVKGYFPSGEEALAFLKKNRVDLVLMDIHLRGTLDGIETAEEILRTYRIPVIYLTAFTDEATIARAKFTEPFGFISKSFDFRDLHITIEMTLYKNKMEKRVRESENLLATTLASIRDAVVTTDPEGRIRYINRGAEKLLGISSSSAEGKRLDDFRILASSNDRQQTAIPFMQDRLTTDMNHGQNRFYLVNARKEEIPVECRISPLLDEKGEVSGHVFVFSDITELLKGEETNSRLVSIVESSEDAIIGITIEGKVISWNRGAESIFGYTEDEVLGRDISMLAPPFYSNEFPGILEGLRQGRAYEYEAMRQTKNGAGIIVSMKVTAIMGKDGTVRMGSVIARDITMRKRLEKELLEIEDRERNRIGQDLHDNLGQQLTGISLKLRALENRLLKGKDPAVSDEFRDISKLVREAINDTRKIAKGLIPVRLTSESLGAAIMELVNRFDEGSAIAIIPKIDEDISLKAPIVSVQLYHIAQEALTNAVKYSRAETIEITLRKESSELVLSVLDNGTGFECGKTDGLGLLIMQYRANVAGGRLSIVSERGKGTSIICRVPLGAF